MDEEIRRLAWHRRRRVPVGLEGHVGVFIIASL